MVFLTECNFDVRFYSYNGIFVEYHYRYIHSCTSKALGISSDNAGNDPRWVNWGKSVSKLLRIFNQRSEFIKLKF